MSILFSLRKQIKVYDLVDSKVISVIHTLFQTNFKRQKYLEEKYHYIMELKEKSKRSLTNGYVINSL